MDLNARVDVNCGWKDGRMENQTLVAGDVFDGVFLCCPFSHEMSWMRSGT